FYPGRQMVTLIIQAVASKRPDTAHLSMLSSLYKESYMLGTRWTIAENLVWTQALFQEQEAYSYFYHSNLNWGFKEAWSLEFNVDIFDGSADSVLGTYDRNDRV